jgi:hypothetical protein
VDGHLACDFGRATFLNVKANVAERGIRSMSIEFQNSHGSFSFACIAVNATRPPHYGLRSTGMR